MRHGNLYLKDFTATRGCRCVHAAAARRSSTSRSPAQHIESLGYDIVANFGDQFSDLNGGFADQTFKIPNPTYFLP